MSSSIAWSLGAQQAFRVSDVSLNVANQCALLETEQRPETVCGMGLKQFTGPGSQVDAPFFSFLQRGKQFHAASHPTIGGLKSHPTIGGLKSRPNLRSAIASSNTKLKLSNSPIGIDVSVGR